MCHSIKSWAAYIVNLIDNNHDKMMIITKLFFLNHLMPHFLPAISKLLFWKKILLKCRHLKHCN